MRIIQNRSLKNMVIVDNSIIAFANNMESGIHVPTFIGDREDRALLSLLPLLKSLAEAEDVRTELGRVASIPALYEWYLEHDETQS